MLTEIVLALGYNSIDKNRALTTKKKQKQSTHNSLASHRTHRTHSRPFSSASHRTHRVRTSKRIHMEHIESDQNRGKKKRAPNVERERLTKRQTA